jgi:S-adenosylmethionine hydrolase
VKPVVLLTDFGHDDHYAGVLHSVLVRSAPGIERVDLSHAVPAGDVWAASFLLRCAWPHLPGEAVVLVVVDPGVGTARRALAVRLGKRWLVAPDNGVASACGTSQEAVELDAKDLGVESPSATFHGRDLFAPAAARIARGDWPGLLGRPVDVSSLVPCPLPEPQPSERGWTITVLHVDRFGNIVSNLPASEMVGDVQLMRPVQRTLRRVSTYGEAGDGEVVALEGSSGLLELALNRGSAAAALGWRRGQELMVRVGAG